MSPWDVGLIALIVLGLAAIVAGALWDRRRNARRRTELLAPPSRAIPGFTPDAPAPHYLSDLQARRPPDESPAPALTDADRDSIRRGISAPTTETLGTGYASADFISDPTSGWAVLDSAGVLVCADEVASIRELLPVLERALLGGHGLVIVAPGFAPEVLATLEVNAIRRTLPLLAVKASATDRARITERCRAELADRATLQSGYLPGTLLGRCDRWVSTDRASYLMEAAAPSSDPST